MASYGGTGLKEITYPFTGFSVRVSVFSIFTPPDVTQLLSRLASRPFM